jgi:hypothetical protein
MEALIFIFFVLLNVFSYALFIQSNFSNNPEAATELPFPKTEPPTSGGGYPGSLMEIRLPPAKGRS